MPFIPARRCLQRRRRTWFVDIRHFSSVLQPTHLERALTSRYSCDVSTCCCITSTGKQVDFFFCSSSPRLGRVEWSPCSGTSADIWASTNFFLASSSIPVLKKFSPLKRGSCCDGPGHPRLESYFHDETYVRCTLTVPPTEPSCLFFTNTRP